MKPINLKYLFTILLSIFCLSGYSAILKGTVLDQNNYEPLPFAKVIIYQNGGNQFQSSTDLNGEFTFNNIPSGSYEITVNYNGYFSETLRNVIVSENAEKRIDIYLAQQELIQQTQPSVTVLGNSIQLSKKAGKNKLDKSSLSSPKDKNQSDLDVISSSGDYYNDNNSINDINYQQEISRNQDEQLFNNSSSLSLGINNERRDIRNNSIVFLSPFEQPLSTFPVLIGKDNFTYARKELLKLKKPNTDLFKLEEWANHFDYNYDKTQKDFEVFSDVVTCPWNDQNVLLQIGLNTKSINKNLKSKSDIVFLIDISGSMYPRNKLPAFQKALAEAIDYMSPDDRITLYAYGDKEGMILPPTKVKDGSFIKMILTSNKLDINPINESVLGHATKTLSDGKRDAHNKRIIVVTDGDFNILKADEAERLVKKNRDASINLSILGMGMGTYRAPDMERLVSNGNGNFSHIQTEQEAKIAILRELGSQYQIVAEDAKVRVEINPAKVESYRLLGFDGEEITSQLASNEEGVVEIPMGYSATVFYELKLKNDVADSKEENEFYGLKYQRNVVSEKAINSNELLTFKMIYNSPNEEKNLIEKAIFMKNSSPSPQICLGAAVMSMGMNIKREKKIASTSTIENYINCAHSILSDTQLSELRALLKQMDRSY